MTALLTVAGVAAGQEPSSPDWEIGCGTAVKGQQSAVEEKDLSELGEGPGSEARKSSVCSVRVMAAEVDCADMAATRGLFKWDGTISLSSDDCVGQPRPEEHPKADRWSTYVVLFTPPQSIGDHPVTFTWNADSTFKATLRVYDPAVRPIEPASPPPPPAGDPLDKPAQHPPIKPAPGPNSGADSSDSKEDDMRRYAVSISGAVTPDVLKPDTLGGSGHITYSPWGRDQHIFGEFGLHAGGLSTHAPLTKEGLPEGTDADLVARMTTLSIALTGGIGLAPVPKYLSFNLSAGLGGKGYFKDEAEVLSSSGALQAQDDEGTKVSPLILFQLIMPVTLGKVAWLAPGTRVELAPMALTESGSGDVTGLDVHFTVMALAGIYLDAPGFTYYAPTGTTARR